MGIYTYNSNTRELVSSDALFPIIKLSNLSTVKISDFINYLNGQILYSSEFRNNLIFYKSEGVVLTFVNYGEIVPNSYNYTDPVKNLGGSFYNKDADGNWINGPNDYEVEIYITVTPGGSSRDYAVTFDHELAHPRFRRHAAYSGTPLSLPQYAAYYVGDPAYSSEAKTFAQIGSTLKVDGASAAAIGVSSGNYIFTADGFAAWQQKEGDPNAIPSFPYTIVTETKFVTAYAYELAGIDIANKKTPSGGETNQEIHGLLDASGRIIFKTVRTVSYEKLTQFSQIGTIIGSTIGNYLAGENKLAGILYSSVLGEIGERIGTVIAGAPGNFNIPQALKVGANGNVIKPSFLDDVFARMSGAAVGTISSILAAQLSQALGLKGFGGELFTTVASTGTNAVINTIVSNAGTPATGALHKDLFDGVFEGKNFASGAVWGNVIGAFIGAKLANVLVKPETEAAVVLSSVGAAVGSYIGYSSAVGGVAAGSSLSFGSALLATGWGAFVWAIYGTLIGNLFGHKKPKVPTASAETALQLPFARYELGTATSANGGSLDLAQGMAANARDILNGLISQITRSDDKAYVSNLSGSTTTQAYGHTGGQLYVKVNGATHNVSSADEAVEYGTLVAVRNTKVVGGDLFLKRVVKNSAASDLLALSGDLQTATDYGFYSNNRELINGYFTDAFPVSALTSVDQTFYNVIANKTIVDKLALVQTLTTAENTTYQANKAQFDRAAIIVRAKKDQDFYVNTNKTIVDKILSVGPPTSYTTTETTAYTNNKAAIDRIVAAIKAKTTSALSTTDQSYYTANKTLVDKIAGSSLTPAEATTYNASKAQFDRVVSMVGAQTIANPWMVTLLRASELKLDQFASSDFYGGLGGFLNSLGVNKSTGTYYENSTFRASGTTGAVVSVATPGSTSSVFDVLPQAMRSPDGNDIRDGHGDFISSSQWSKTSTGTGQIGVNVGAGWYGNGNDVIFSQLVDTGSGVVTNIYSDYMTSKAGASYEASVYAAEHRAAGSELWIEYYNENKVLIGTGTKLGTAALGKNAANGLLTNFSLLTGTTTAPAGTAYRRIVLKHTTNGTAIVNGVNQASYGFFTRPETHEVISGVTPDLNWEETGHSVYIDQMSKVGYTVAAYGSVGGGSPVQGWQITNGNDLIDQSGKVTAVSLDDYRSFQIDTHSQAGIITQTFTGGDDIFLGGARERHSERSWRP